MRVRAWSGRFVPGSGALLPHFSPWDVEAALAMPDGLLGSAQAIVPEAPMS